MGKGGGGKNKGKLAFTLAFAVVGGLIFAAAPLGFATGALYGATVGSTLWTVTHKPNMGDFNYDTDYSNDDYSRFNQTSNDVNQNAVIPIIYGTRKFGGLQTWYNLNNGSRNLEKDVVICHSGIDSVYNVCANEELIRDNTNIYIYNTQYKDARIKRVGNTLYLYANGTEQTFSLGYISDEHYDARDSLLSIVLDKIKQDAGSGWKIDGALKDETKKGISANSMKFGNANYTFCYVDPLDKERKNAVVLDDRGYSIGTYTLYQGTAPDNYMETGSYAGCAWIRSNLIASQRLSGSNPTINSYIKGMKVKVWKNNQWVVEYSENPAWIIRDFLTNKVYGTGQWITEDLLDINSFIEVANYCDEIIEYKDNNGNIQRCPRYTLNIILDSQKQPIEHLSSMLAVFGGFFTLGDKIALKVEKAETPVYSFDNSTIVKDSMSIGQTALSDTPNRYKIGYFDPYQNWTEVKVVVEDLELQHDQNDQINEKTVTLAGCTSQNQALRLGRLYRDVNKVCALTCSFSVATQGMMLECGDVVTVSYDDIFTNMPFRITEIQETKDGVYQLTCRQYNPSLYDDSLGATIINPTYGNIQSSLLNDVPPITELTLIEENTVNSDGSLATNIIASWNGDKITNFSSYLVSLSTDGVNYKSVGSFTDNVARIPNCVVGQTYFVCVQNINNMGIESVPTVATITLIGDGITPSTPSNLRIKLTDVFRIIWNKVPSSNIKYYEVRTDTNYGNEVNLLGRVESPELSTNIITERTGTIYVYAVSIYNQYSAPAQIEYDFPARKLYVLNANAKFQGIDLSTNSVPNNCMGVRWFITNSTDSRTVTTTDSVYFHNCNAGIYNVNACYYDYFGEGERFDADGNGKIVTVVATISAELIAEGAIAQNKLSKTISDSLDTIPTLVSDVQTLNDGITTINGKITSLETDTAGNKTLIEQTSSELSTLSTTVGGNTTSIQQNANSISTIVTNLGKTPSESSYSAITQLDNAIGLKVGKSEYNGTEIIKKVNEIIVTEDTTLIDGKLLHVTGDSVFDEDVIIKGQMVAGSVSCDDGVSINAGAVTITKSGLTCQTKDEQGKDTGSVVFNSLGMQFLDSLGNTFSQLGRFSAGVAKHNDFIELNWDVAPKTVLLFPYSMQTMVAGYSSSALYLKCFANAISAEGFRVNCYTTIGDGSYANIVIPEVSTYRTYRHDYDWYWGLILYSEFTNFTVPEGANEVTISARCNSYAYYKWQTFRINGMWCEIWDGDTMIDDVQTNGANPTPPGTSGDYGAVWATWSGSFSKTYQGLAGKEIRLRIRTSHSIKYDTAQVTMTLDRASARADVKGETVLSEGTVNYLALG